MIDSVIKELKDFLPLRRADEAAKPLPAVILTPVEERLIFRADGRDYLTDVLFRADAYGKDLTQTRALFAYARKLITNNKPFMRTEQADEAFDHENCVYRVGGSFRAHGVIKEET
ncbi:MAG: hypothetical protein IKT57_05915 [Clostridia bacterium]|nr:hypothetical protein [Clostridia bacterium]